MDNESTTFGLGVYVSLYLRRKQTVVQVVPTAIYRNSTRVGRELHVESATEKHLSHFTAGMSMCFILLVRAPRAHTLG